MSISNKIVNWFQTDGSYVDGLSLYAHIGGSIPLSRFQSCLDLSYVPDNLLSLLQHELQSYLEQNPVEAQVVEEIIVQPISTPKEPIEVAQLKAKAIPFHKRHQYLHALLTKAQSDEDRYELAHEIMEEVQPELDRIYDAIRAYYATGELPKPAQSNDLVKSTIEKYKRVLSLRPRISKLKKWLEEGNDLTDIKRQDYQKELALKEVELEELEMELDVN